MASDDRLFRRDGIYYARVRGEDGVIVRRSTKCRTRSAAETVYRQLEKQYADPAHHAANQATLRDAIYSFLRDRKVAGKAQGTLRMYDVKTAHLARILGEKTRLVAISAKRVDDYVNQRKENEGAHPSTIGKELTALRGVLKLAKRHGLFRGDLKEIMPISWSVEYVPRTRFLSVDETVRLLDYLATGVRPDGVTYLLDTRGRRHHLYRGDELRAAYVAFAIATGARKSEVERARLEDIDLVGGKVLLRGSKTAKSWRHVPITPLSRGLLRRVIAWTGERMILFPPWANVWRDLKEACAVIGMPTVSANDLRRTHATWLRQRGVEPSLIAEVLGHVDSRMVERVYGKVPFDALATMLNARLVGAGDAVSILGPSNHEK